MSPRSTTGRVASVTALALTVVLAVVYPFHFYLSVGENLINMSYGDLLIGIIGALWLAGFFSHRAVPRYIALVCVFAMIALLSLGVAAVFGSQYLSISSGVLRLVKFLGSVAWLMGIFIIGYSLRLDRFRSAMLAFPLVAVVFALSTLYASFFGSAFRPSGPFVNPNIYANYLLLNVFLMLYCWTVWPLSKHRRVSYTVTGVGVVVLLLALIDTGSRGTLIGLGAAVVAAITFTGAYRRASLPTAVIFVTGAIAVPVTVWYQNPYIIDRLLSVQNVEIRLQAWSAAIDALATNPVLGVGYGQFNSFSSIVLGQSLPSGAHNTYLTVVSEVGLLGLVTFGAVLVWPVWDGARLRGRHSAAAFAAAAIVGSAAQGFVTDVDNFRTLWIAIGIVAIHSSARETVLDLNSPQKSLAAVTATLKEAVSTVGAMSWTYINLIRDNPRANREEAI